MIWLLLVFTHLFIYFAPPERLHLPSLMCADVTHRWAFVRKVQAESGGSATGELIPQNSAQCVRVFVSAGTQNLAFFFGDEGLVDANQTNTFTSRGLSVC